MKSQIIFRLDEDTVQQLEAIVKDNKLNKSKLLRSIVEEFICKYYEVNKKVEE